MTKETLIPFPVPTSTVIAYHQHDPYKVWVIEQAKKHRGRLTLVGGRCELPGQSHETCITEEWQQEAGGNGPDGIAAELTCLQYFLTKNDRFADPRETTLGKLTSGKCPKKLLNQPVLGLYGSPDAIYLGRVIGTPYPNDGEAKQCLLFDIRELVITETADQSKFGAQHDLLLGLYRRFVDRKFHGTNEMLTDMNELRSSLLSIQASGWK